MISISKRIPNLAGIALVDILANGVAVLVIVIVISIAVRSEQEKRYSEQVQEVSAVMTREFSTSLVLNRLAASEPARLHDYENDPLDAYWDPDLLPILEIHADFVRDPYSALVWAREQLLEQPNSLDRWLVEFTPERKDLLRLDIFDVGMFYLLTSQLQEHGFRMGHWHFLGGSMSLADAARCPPGVSAVYCVNAGAALGDTSFATEFLSERNQDVNTEDGEWRSELGDLEGSGNATIGLGGGFSPADGESGSSTGEPNVSGIPSGASLASGRGTGEASDRGGRSARSQYSGSFPSASSPSFSGTDPSADGSQEGGSASSSSSDGESRLRLRLATPWSQEVEEGQELPFEMGEDSLVLFISALLRYTTDLQDALDANHPPNELLGEFMQRMASYLQSPRTLSEEERTIAEDLSLNMQRFLQANQESPSETVEITMDGRAVEEESVIRLIPNRILLDVDILGSAVNDGEIVDPNNRVQFSMNAYPDIWLGLTINAVRGGALVTPIEQTLRDTPRWRAAAWISPELNDMIVGFVYATVDAYGRFHIFSDTNRGRLGSRHLVTVAQTSWFDVKTWLVVFYTVLSIGLLALLLFWRPWASRSN